MLLNRIFSNHSLLDKIKKTSVIINPNVNTTLKLNSKKEIIKISFVLSL